MTAGQHKANATPNHRIGELSESGSAQGVLGTFVMLGDALALYGTYDSEGPAYS